MIAVVDPFTGVAGDMLLAALLDAGAPIDAVRASIAATGLTGWTLQAEPGAEHGIAATHVRVEVDDDATERHAAVLLGLATRATPAPVAAAAVAVLTRIAEVEARLHGTTVDAVHLHELGGHDTVVDVVGVCAALHHLGVDRLFVAGPLPLGRGTVTTRHGVLPLPAPATAALLSGVPTVPAGLTGETVTPTGAALLTGLGASWAPAPAAVTVATGYGAGTRRLADRPNVVVVRLGDPLPPAPHAAGTDVDGLLTEDLVELATTVDDVPGEVLGHVVDRALASGALDAWVVPATMKKSRPGHVVHVLARPADAAGLRRLLLAETGSLGVRTLPVVRHAVPRAVHTVHVEGHPVRVKTGPFGAKPEHDDLVRVAAALDTTVRELARRVLRELP